MTTPMTSNRPYLIRALYEWILDNNMTPHLLAKVDFEGVQVPMQYAHEGRIVLNVNPAAVHNLQLGNELIEFNARFNSVDHRIQVPPDAVLAIYARENGQGMAFADPSVEATQAAENEQATQAQKSDKKPSLKIVK